MLVAQLVTIWAVVVFRLLSIGRAMDVKVRTTIVPGLLVAAVGVAEYGDCLRQQHARQQE